MRKKQQLESVSLIPVGTPQAGPVRPRTAALRDSGRLGTTMKRSHKNAATTPAKPEKPKARAQAERANGGAEFNSASSSVNPSKTPSKKSSTKADQRTLPKKKASNEARNLSTSSTPLPVDSAKQIRASTAAKDARLKEAGLEGRRTGKASASGKRVQARRDSKNS